MLSLEYIILYPTGELDALKAFRQYEKNTVACVLTAGWFLNQLTSVSLMACLLLLVSLLYPEKLASLLLTESLFIKSLMLRLCCCRRLATFLRLCCCWCPCYTGDDPYVAGIPPWNCKLRAFLLILTLPAVRILAVASPLLLPASFCCWRLSIAGVFLLLASLQFLNLYQCWRPRSCHC
jgi:hypothetical protein